MPKKYDKRGFRYKSLVKKKRRKTVRKPQQDLNEPGCSTGQEENTSKSDDGCDELMMDSSIADASLQEEGKLNPSIDWSSLEDESMIYDNSAGDESVKILGRRVIEISHCFRELQRFRHTDYFSCGISDVEIMKEKRSGLFSSFYLMCRMCKSNVWVSTDSLEKMGPKTAAVAGALAIGVGNRQTEEFMAALDIPFMAQETWQKIEQTEVAKFVEGAALEEMLEAGKEEAAIARELGEVDREGFPLVPVITDGTWAKRSYGTKYNSLSGMVI